MVNFHAGSRETENLHFNQLLLSKACKVSDEKVQKSYVSWHWKVMQILEKNWLLVPKMSWWIWWILMRAVASLKICTFMCTTFIESILCLCHKSREELCDITQKIDASLKRSWLVLWKMTRGICQILTQHSKVSKLAL